MQIYCGLENENYKYTYGTFQTNRVPFEVNKQVKVTCGKNDWAAVQLLLYSEKDMIVCVNDDPCFYPKGDRDTVRVTVEVPGISSDNIKTNLVGLVEDDDRQYKSDILLNKKNIFVEAGKVQLVWIEVNINKDVEAKTYRPKITLFGKNMFEDETILNELQYEIDVVDVELDSPKDYKFYLDLWQHNSNIARKYDVPLWSDKHFEIIENYIKSLSDLGQKAITVIASEIPWSGQNAAFDKIAPSDLFEYNMIKVKYTKDNTWEYDFSAMNRYIELCMKHGIDKEIEVFGLNNIWLMEEYGFGKVIKDYEDGIRIRFFDEQDNTYKFIKLKKDLELYVHALEENFTQKGWIDKVRISADEPSELDVFINKVNQISSMAPKFKFKVAINHIEFMGHNIPNVVDYCPSLGCVCDKFDELQKVKGNVDGTISYYVCCGPDYPNTFICSPLIEARIIPWIAWYLDIDGFLRWNYTVWPDDPLNKIVYKYPCWKAGDTNFVYPGKDGKPMLTVRYKNLKRGIRDYEILKRYETKNGRENILETLKTVFKWNDIDELMKLKREDLYSLNYDDYEEIISNMIKNI